MSEPAEPPASARTAAPTPAPPPVAPPAAARPPAPAPADAPTTPQAAAPAKPTPADLTPAPAPALRAPEPALALPAAPPALPALTPLGPRPERVTLHAPSALPEAEVETAAAALADAGFVSLDRARAGFPIARTHVRYYHAQDAAAAAALAAALPGGQAEARDFTNAPQAAAPGRREVWLAGEPRPAAPRRQTPRAEPSNLPPDAVLRGVMRQVEGTVRTIEQGLGDALDRAAGAP